jgi:hypothetical protein
MKTKKKHFSHFGPEMPLVPIGDFSKLSITEKDLEAAWGICGPSADRNMQRKLQLWQVIVIAYLEGLNHGASLQPRAGDGVCGAGIRLGQSRP